MTPEETLAKYRHQLTRQITSAIRDTEGDGPVSVAGHIVELMELNGFFDPVKTLYGIRAIFNGYEQMHKP